MHKLNGFSLSWPADWSGLFGRERPLIVEIGFGRGQFLMHLAQTYPDYNVVGLEISNRCLEAAERAIERLQLANVRVVHATAEMGLHHLFEPASLSQVHVNFPDPWFKTKHSHRRLMQRDTLDAVVNRMKSGGLFYLATDILEYAEMSAEALNKTPQLDNLLPTDWVNEMAGRIVTKYEAIARREGRACYYFARQRNRLPAPDVPVLKELAMPHLVFTSPVTLDEIQAQFAPRKHEEGETIVSFMAVYRGNDALLFEVFVKEMTTTQHVALLLDHHRDGGYTLHLATIGLPRPTPGLHRAVFLLGDWLLRLHSDARIVKTSVQGAKAWGG